MQESYSKTSFVIKLNHRFLQRAQIYGMHPLFLFYFIHFLELLNVTSIKKKINANECFSISCDNLTLNPQIITIIIIIIIIINHHIMAYQGYTVGHYARASSGLVDVKPREQITYISPFEQEIKLVRL